MPNCSGCGIEIAMGEGVLVAAPRKQESPVALCDTCVAKIESIFVAETLHPKVLPAAALGLVAGLVAAGIWYAVVAITNFQLGIVAVGVGWAVAKAVSVGSGKKRGGVLPWISVAIALVAMASGQYLVIRHFIVEELAAEGVANIPLLLSLELMVQLVYEGLKADPVTLLFWIIALWQAYALVRKRRLPTLKAKPGEVATV